MTDAQEIINRANIAGVNPHAIEKNHALSWLLAAFFSHPELRDKWIFKGGTCIKKCYFETFRFSEDLDFTVTDSSHLTDGMLKSIFRYISKWLEKNHDYLRLPDIESQTFKQLKAYQYQVYISYVGSISQMNSLQKVKFDLTSNELLVDKPIQNKVFHPYSDQPQEGLHIMSYSYEEVFAEKIRALAERSNPRDLYDVVNLYRHAKKPDVNLLNKLLKYKCEFKNIPIPTLQTIEKNKKEISSHWHDMLGNQLLFLPSLENYWKDLSRFFKWLNNPDLEFEKIHIKLPNDQKIMKDQALSLNLPTKTKKNIVKIRFASANQLHIKIAYSENQQDIPETLEAYTLTQKEDGHIILHAWSITESKLKTYLVNRIKQVDIKDQYFEPRYKINIIPNL